MQNQNSRNKKVKVLFLVNDLYFFCTHRLPIAKSIMSLGFEVVIGYGDLGGASPKILERDGFILKYVPMERGGKNLFKDLKTLFLIFKLFSLEKPDILHTVTIKPYLYGGIISRITRVPSLVSAVSGLGTLFIQDDFKTKLLRLFLFPIFSFAFNHKNQIVIFQNKDDANLLTSWGVLNPKKIRLIRGSGVDLSLFKDLEEKNSIPIVCFVARLLVDKGVYEFVSAARILKKRGIEAKFYLAGTIDEKNNTGLTKNELNIIKKEGIVEVIGFQKNIPGLFSKSHIICLPSYREGLPKSLIEAAAASRAVITTDVPGCRDAIEPYVTGLLVPVKNKNALADAIQDLIEDPQKRISMGKEGRKLAEKEFIIEKIVNAHIDIYKELI